MQSMQDPKLLSSLGRWVYTTVCAYIIAVVKLSRMHRSLWAADVCEKLSPQKFKRIRYLIADVRTRYGGSVYEQLPFSECPEWGKL